MKGPFLRGVFQNIYIYLFYNTYFGLLKYELNILTEKKVCFCDIQSTGKSLSKALRFVEHGEIMLCTKIVLNIGNNFCTQHVSELGIFMY